MKRGVAISTNSAIADPSSSWESDFEPLSPWVTERASRRIHSNTAIAHSLQIFTTGANGPRILSLTLTILFNLGYLSG